MPGRVRPVYTRGAPPRPIPFTVDGFVGMRDQRSATYAPGEMEAVYDMIPEANDRPSKLLVRPGFRRFAAPGITTAGRLDSGAATIKLIASVTDPFGGNPGHTYVVSNNELYRLDLTALTVTKMLSAAQISAAGATALSSGTKLQRFNGKLVVANGTGQPWTWDGTSGGGITILTNAPNGVFDVTVFAGKLFFVKLDGKTIVWSEELAENTGYEAGGFSNRWDLSVVSRSPISWIVGIEEGLFVFRNVGITVIRGQVNTNFTTTATRDAVSETVTAGQGKPVAVNGAIIFWDALTRPHCYRSGSGVVELWRQMPRFWGQPDASMFFSDLLPYSTPLTPQEPTLHSLSYPDGLRAFYDAYTGCHVFSQCGSGGAYAYLFDARTDRLVAIWNPPMQSPTYGGIAGTYANYTTPTWVKVDGDGYVYLLVNAINTGTEFNDETSTTAGSPVKGTIIGPPHGANATAEYRWQEARVLVEARANHTVRFAYVTSRDHKGSLTAGSQTFTENPSNAPFEERVRFGLNALGRWMRPQIQVEAAAGSTAQPGIYGYELEAVPVGTGDAR